MAAGWRCRVRTLQGKEKRVAVGCQGIGELGANHWRGDGSECDNNLLAEDKKTDGAMGKFKWRVALYHAASWSTEESDGGLFPAMLPDCFTFTTETSLSLGWMAGCAW